MVRLSIACLQPRRAQYSCVANSPIVLRIIAFEWCSFCQIFTFFSWMNVFLALRRWLFFNLFHGGVGEPCVRPAKPVPCDSVAFLGRSRADCSREVWRGAFKFSDASVRTSRVARVVNVLHCSTALICFISCRDVRIN